MQGSQQRRWEQRLRRRCGWLCVFGVGLLAVASPVMACDKAPAGTILWVQLISGVSSYDAKPGTQVQAVLEDDVSCDGEVLFPIGTRVEGTVRRVQKVG